MYNSDTMISDAIRILLVLGSMGTLVFVLRRIRKAQVQIEDSIFWILFSVGLLILSIWPQLIYQLSYALGFQSPMSMVYLSIIFLLLIHQFSMTVRLSQMDSKLRSLSQKVALNQEKNERDNLDL